MRGGNFKFVQIIMKHLLYIRSLEISIVVILGKLDVKISHRDREKSVIFLSFKSEPEAS